MLWIKINKIVISVDKYLKIETSLDHALLTLCRRWGWGSLQFSMRVVFRRPAYGKCPALTLLERREVIPPSLSESVSSMGKRRGFSE